MGEGPGSFNKCDFYPSCYLPVTSIRDNKKKPPLLGILGIYYSHVARKTLG